MNRNKLLLLILTYLIFSNPLNVSALRPLETDNIAVLGLGQFALENGFYHIDTLNVQKYQLLETAKIGLPGDIELDLEIPYIQQYPLTGGEFSGIGDTSIAIKKQLNEVWGFKIGGKLFRGNFMKDLGGSSDSYLFLLHDLSVATSTVSTNIGYNIINAGPNTFRLNLAWYIPAEDIFALVGEVNAETTFKEEGFVTGLLGARAKIGFGVWDISFRRYFELSQNTYGMGLTIYN